MKVAAVVGMAAALAAGGGTALAATATVRASDNSTVKPAGPRAGTSNLSFFNVEGSSNTTNASYGVMDFSGGSFGITGSTAVSALSLALTESDAAFTLPGTLNVYLAGSSAAGIKNDGTSSLIFDTSATTAPSGVDAANLSAFGGLTLLGTLAFTTTGNTATGAVDTFSTSTLAPGASSALAALLNSGGTIRLVITPETATAAATFAGLTNTTLAGPALTLTSNGTAAAVPEPASLGLLVLGGLLLGKRRRR